MSQPTRPYLRDVFHTINLASRVPYLLYDLGLDSVEHAGKDGLARLPHDHEDGRRYQEPYDGVCEWVAEPHPHGPGQDGEARPAVGPCVVAVRHKRRAPYLPADPDAEHGHRLVAQEPDHGRHGDGPQHPYGLRMDKPIDCLVSGNDGAEEDDEDDEYTSQVLDPPVAEGEAPAGAQTRQREGDPQGYGRGRVAEAVDGVREQGHAAREQHHNNLH